MKQHTALKLFASLLPALIFTQNWGWMTENQMIGTAFLLLWAGMIWFVFSYQDKNKILYKIFRSSEIGCFLLPISALILTFVVGALSMGRAEGGAEQAGAAIGTAIGGMFAVAIGFVIGLFGGIIFHLIANRFEKKIVQTEKEEGSNFFSRHKALTIIAVMVVLLMISLGKSAATVTDDKNTDSDTQQNINTSLGTPSSGSNSEANRNIPLQAQQAAVQKQVEPSPVEVISTSITENIIGSPVANVKIKNISAKTIDGIKVKILAFNNFGEPANGFLTDNSFNGISQEVVAPGAIQEFSWDLFGYDTATKIQASVYEAHFSDGSTWGGE